MKQNLFLRKSPKVALWRYCLMAMMAFATLNVNTASAQCNNPSAFGTGALPTVVGGFIDITTCAFAGEYSTGTGAQIGYQYQFTCTPTTAWLTIRTGTSGGPVVAQGVGPLTYTAVATGNIYIHMNTNSSCGTASVCHTPRVTLLSTASCSGTPSVATVVATPSQTTYCSPASPVLSLSGSSTGAGISYQWYNSSNGTTWNLITGATAATYTVPGITSSLLYRCNVLCSTSGITTTSNQLLINVASSPVVSATANPSAICSGGSTTITAAGATSYVWAPGGATTPSVTVSPTGTTTYTVTGTLGSCTGIGTAVVTVGSPFTTSITANPTQVCVGGNTQLSALAPPVASGSLCVPTYSSGTAFGDYCNAVSITGTTLTNTTGPSGSPYYTVYPQSGSTTATLTAGTTYTIVMTAGTYSFNDLAAWIDYNSNNVLTDALEKLGETDDIGSGASTSFVFTVPATAYNGVHRLRVREADQGTIGGMDPCVALSFGEVEDYSITIVGGQNAVATSPAYLVNWSESLGGTTLASTTANPVNANNLLVNKTYSVSVARNGCTATANITVNANPLPTATMTTTTPTRCAGQQPSITITGTPNTNVIYSINGTNQPAVNTGVGGSVTFTPPAISANTAYALVSATTPATTCTATLTGGVTITVNQRPAGQFLGTSTVCKNNPAFIGFGSPSGPTVFPIYVTFTDGTTTYLDTAAGAGENFPIPTNVPGVYTYTLASLTSVNGCSAIAADMNGTATVTVKDLPTAVVTSTVPGICPGGNTDVTLTFTGDAPFSFNYYNGIASTGGSSVTNTYTFNVTPTAATTYYVENLLDNNVCVATAAGLADSTTVVLYDTVSITTQPVATINACSQTAAIITMTANGQNLVYTWYENGSPVVAGPNYTINNGILTVNNITGLGGNQYYVVVSGDCGAAQTSNSTTLIENFSNNWSGTVSSDWNNGMNWSCGTVPIVTTDVFIGAFNANYPLVEIGNAVCHDLTLNGSGTSLGFMPGANQLIVYGDVMNSGGTINGTGGTLELGGTVQSVTGPVTLGNLEVTGGGVKTFSNDVTIAGSLNLMSGNIQLGTTNLTLAQPLTQLGGSASSFIETNGTGKVIANNMGAIGGNPGAVMFHVGINGGSYTPMSLDNLGDADNYSVRVMPNVYEDGTGIIPTTVTNPVVNRTWIVEEVNAGGSIVTMEPYWNTPTDEINGFDPTHVFVAHYTGGEWISYVDSASGAPAATPAGPGMFKTTLDSLTSFSPFTVASSGQFPLAIRLSSITATNVGTRNKVQWKSETEDAGDSYELESSADGKKFTKIATVADNGKASTYTQWDEQPVQGVNYYRVKLVNIDGSSSYSKVVTATVRGTDGFSIEAYPNPVKNTVSVKVDGVVTGKATVVITDVTGKVVKAATQVLNNGAEINVTDLANGIYLLNYTDDVRSESIKINKQ